MYLHSGGVLPFGSFAPDAGGWYRQWLVPALHPHDVEDGLLAVEHLFVCQLLLDHHCRDGVDVLHEKESCPGDFGFIHFLKRTF